MEPFFVLLGLALLFSALVVPWIALALALRSRRAADELRRETAALREQVAWLRALAERGAEPSAAGAAAPSRPSEGAASALALPPSAPVAPTPAVVAPAPPPVPAAAFDGDESVPTLKLPAASAVPPAADAPGPSAPSPSPAAGRAIGGLEERLGARLPIWIGAIALALAGIFLVQYSIERGWLAPPVRVALGVLFGVALLGGGEFLRRKSERIAMALSAAGVAVLYAAFLAATSLYRLISPTVGFGLMALNTAVAVGLALRQGPLVAALGLLGGFATPALVRTEVPNVPGLVAYLLLLQVGLLAVTRRRQWLALAAASLLGGVLWVLLLVAQGLAGENGLWLGLFVVASGAAALWAVRDAGRGATGAQPFGAASPWLAGGALLLGLVAYAFVAGSAEFGALEWSFFGLLALGCLGLARREPALEALAWLAGAAIAVLLAAWGLELTREASGRFLATAAAIGVVFVVASYLLHWGAARPERWSWLVTAVGFALFLIAALSARRFEPEAPWGFAALGGAALYLVGALPLARRRASLEAGDERLAALSVGVTALATLAVPLEFERQWLTIAWALEVPLLLALATRLRVPLLAKLATALASAVAVRLLVNPAVLDYPLGTTPIWNGLLYLYGLPLAAFALGAALARRSGEERLAEGLAWGATALGAALLLFELRHLFRAGSLAPPPLLPLHEWGAIALAWALAGVALLGVGARWPWRPLRWGGAALLSLGLGLTLVGPGLVLNPAFEREAVGATPFANSLAWLFGAPLLAALAGMRRLERWDRPVRPLVWSWGGAALALAFLWLTLAVRQLFRGEVLTDGVATGAENLAYSASWMLLGLGLLVFGVVRAHRLVRQAGLGILLLVVLKVFLYDLSALTGLYRVLSFLGLGASLLLLAYVYQRLVAKGAENR